ncbi:MAG: hypothetical protein AABX16_04725 [Nanoarchaeota archaeon]
MKAVDLSDIEIDGLDNISKQLILKGEYSNALIYLDQIYKSLSKSIPNNFQEWNKRKETPTGKRVDTLGKICEAIREYERVENRVRCSSEDHLDAFYKCQGVSGAEAAAEWISSQSAPSRVEIEIDKSKDLSKLGDIIRSYCQ